MKMNVIILIIMLIHVTSCKKMNEFDDVLSLQRQNYQGNELFLDGFYYTETENFEGIIFNRYAFYENGITRYLGSSKLLLEPNFVSGNAKQTWGIFQIENGKIKFERWYPSSGGPLMAFVRSGQVLNDTTFHITESYRMQNGQKTEIRVRDEIYHFQQFSPKPDSTNKFVP